MQKTKPVKAKVYIVIGSGPVGIRFVQELLRQTSINCKIILYGKEPHLPYDRVRLSSLLAGKLDQSSIETDIAELQARQVDMRFGLEVTSIDKHSRTIHDSANTTTEYDELIIATGSRPHIPSISGTDLDGVFTFRDMNDAEQLSARQTRTQHCVVIGGGLLGIETARAMRHFHTHISIIEHGTHLMQNQLDESGALLLQQQIEQRGIKVRTSCNVRRITGDIRVKGVELASGEVLPCDTVILATGIQANTQLALQAAIPIGRGIKINEKLETGFPNIYAVGECAEFNGQVYGLVAPGFEQAALLARRLGGSKDVYKGSLAATRLKLLDTPVFSAGISERDAEGPFYSRYSYQTRDHYCKIILHNGRLVGANAVGDWPEYARVVQAINAGKRVLPWHLKRFARTGRLWDIEVVSAANWPASTTVCNCRGVCRGDISAHIRQGARSIDAIAERTGASTVCGSCKPVIADLLGQHADREADRYSVPAIALAVTALLIAGMFWQFEPAVASSVQQWHWSTLWTDSLYKQISGYTLLGLVLIVLLLTSLRKRVEKFKWGQFSLYRLLHICTAVTSVALLIGHTGLQSASNLNFYLLAIYITLTLSGALLALVVALEHKISPLLAKRSRSILVWSHVLAFWPLPVLAGMHITTVYYY